ncbi:glycine dehydrogenase (decarboxylating) subunit 2 [uncultured archaeon]|nr:glycine dehydrogenase (decarboxylating) subunit 2 [uncultured archaeon]
MTNLIFEKSRNGRRGVIPPRGTAGEPIALPKEALRKSLHLPELGEVDVVRHFTELASRNYNVDKGFYPLGSCTMKYNPKINEDAANQEGFLRLHPLQEEDETQGAMRLMYTLSTMLSEITGFPAFTLQPAAGAHGELTGLLIIKAALKDKNETRRNRILIPDSAHGTNPASAAALGFEIVEIPSDGRGNISLDLLAAEADDRTAALMLTNPSTLGLFEENILQVTKIIHDAGGYVYGDGANLNAIVGITRPADLGFDVLHINLHKTFATPHGSGGPGSGPVGVTKDLEPYLPAPILVKKGGRIRLDYNREKSIGRVRSYFGNFGVMVRAYAYMRSLGGRGLKRMSEQAVLSANYMRVKLKDYPPAIDRTCMHEVVLTGKPLADETGVHTLDVAKSLLDYGVHAPTIYFPLIVPEALMIEPTETENKDTLDAYAELLLKIRQEAKTNPEKIKTAPHNTPVRRLNETQAARNPVLRWTPKKNGG